MKTASMMILPYLLLAFTGLPVFASASDGEDPAASLLQRGEDIVISGGHRVKRRRKLTKSTKSDCVESPACDSCADACESWKVACETTCEAEFTAADLIQDCKTACDSPMCPSNR